MRHLATNQALSIAEKIRACLQCGSEQKQLRVTVVGKLRASDFLEAL
jgi:hypothetical protein